MIMFLLRF